MKKNTTKTKTLEVIVPTVADLGDAYVASSTTKRKLLDYLLSDEIVYGVEADSSLLDRIIYTAKNVAGATVADLRELKKDIVDFLNPDIAAPMEALEKPKLKAPGKKKAPKTDVADDEEKPVKAKGKVKKPAVKKPGAVETIPGTTTKGADSYPLAVMFPETIETEDYGTLTRASDRFLKWDEVTDAIDAGKQLFFACFWTKRQLRDFGYAEQRKVKIPKEGFPNDLDLMIGVLPCSTMNRLWAMSVYTEAMSYFEEDELAYIEDTDPRKEENAQFRVRMSSGLEYEIYVPASED